MITALELPIALMPASPTPVVLTIPELIKVFPSSCALMAADPAVVIVPWLATKLLPPPARIPRALGEPLVVIVPELMIVLDPSAALMPSALRPGLLPFPVVIIAP